MIEVLSKVSLVVHTLVPENYRFWTSNQQGVCRHEDLEGNVRLNPNSHVLIWRER